MKLRKALAKAKKARQEVIKLNVTKTQPEDPGHLGKNPAMDGNLRSTPSPFI